MNNIDWIFFDLYGTLADSLMPLYHTYKDFLNEYGIKGSKKEFNQLNGPKVNEIVSFLKKKYELKESQRTLLKKYNERIYLIYQKEISPIKGSVKLLETLNKKGYQLALVTSVSKNMTQLFLKRHKWMKYFKTFVYGDDVLFSKPHPNIYKTCLKYTKADKKKVLVIEDSKNGYESATRAGLKCIIVNCKKRKLSNIPQIIKKYD